MKHLVILTKWEKGQISKNTKNNPHQTITQKLQQNTKNNRNESNVATIK
jgi:hypothetical protein